MINDGDCCPVCVRQVSCRNPLSGQSYDAGQTYFNRKQKYCEICTCNSTGGFLCARKTCPLLKCPNPIIIDSSCCPVCPSEIRCKHPKTGIALLLFNDIDKKLSNFGMYLIGKSSEKD